MSISEEQSLPFPLNETERLKALDSYQVVDTAPEEKFDSLTQIAAYICDVPTALISLIDVNRVWFKAKVGMADSETPRNISFCQYAIFQDNIFEIEDAKQDARFKNNPLVLGPPFIRFYAGTPLKTPDGFNIGTLCVIDQHPKRLDEKQKIILKVLSNQVIANFELIKKNRELILVRKKEEELQQSKSQFFANMSHEIRTPIHGILGVAGLLAETDLLSEQKDYVDTIRRSGGLLLGLLNDILDFSKLETAHMKVEIIAFDLNALLKDVFSLFDADAKKKNVEFKLIGTKAAPLTVSTDPNRLRQILVNLVSNAFKFTEKGSVLIEVESDVVGEECDVKIRVRDTGIGIPELKLNELFQAYTQADTSVSRKYGGTGLGLAISKSLAEMMKLELTAQSVVNRGSVFEISGRIPLAEKSEIDFEPRAISDNANGKSQQTNLKILVAEDNEINQMLIRKVLEKLGYKPVVVPNGIEALHYIETIGTDVLFLDIQMPELSGIDTAKILTQHTNQSLRPYIIAMTANASQSDRDKCLAVGMDDYISKPFRKEEIADILERFISDRNSKQNAQK
ncbi:GAF domain-containing hybrid sensor histidine kinase/response regulator [Leptospira yasudae]|uniref:histidine kinase n=1 Tax=Leptospira yasudae TaxID=2202201 RepID=A0A6N4QKK0_9LEPT|nr:GAF domain-containing hybrid sensor histidine kinase/response regulator [Leptospira yasudae]TGL76477.1 hybrid sensor histidine kinase/response regulator [Leptospira yasudae]TGL83400.1 hybrid sensor histidine kinase/response regulator [Leptospira yasudae]TGL89452.1 hybrid sensor histidine kinase/response regulator [Leptospira yasudae]